MKPIHFLGLLLLVVGYFLYQVFYPYISPITIAILLALATFKIHLFFAHKFSSRFIPSLLSTLLLAIIFFAPIIYIITNAATFVTKIDFSLMVESFEHLKQWLAEFLAEHKTFFGGVDMQSFTAKIDANSIINSIVQTATFLGKKSAIFLKDTVLILIFYFFANFYGKDLLLYFQKIIPLKKEDSKTIFENLAGVLGVVFNSIIATAIFEGFLFGIIAQIYGYNGLVFGILYGFASLIPVIGGIIMWLPLSIDRYFHDDTSGAIVIALYSIIVISIIADTFIKPIIIKYIDDVMIEESHVKINELLIFFSIVAGLSSYGFWGMIIGPAVVALTISLLNLYPKLAQFKE
ncbi:AI-2E family transporter [Nitratiruptor sp. YY09-18]|uniref:AI-2E family transporter n=1 Tax=Nitratiruptor sp. YY09-18 TaxID=2724901 RepID=UPI0019163EEE|nr:AI-2E family transporter [Nitratiruptor sp. YY09-18]BCD67517.1 hypothetical protein NitYY0918_C0412 [Nitratiruptor sp. YY09-18]